ncbi:flagellar hook-associated protein FlgK [Bacillus sp. DNRA2]|uniref:flagellar hook-associated protein FlgK n=1 Tax=Bacillus sp. DNRA2 TaxID=2723053 RepID=UPI00145DB962|nr:flagellar hook-associated protein FlgK [Bacillus sp. DNRA2]NMD69081.1 flagellar hook-associated protein FlgK [Bacillus sp. DNRA2]
MASSFHGLEVGKRALFAQQTALSTTGHNIANANSAGYTRQRAEMRASSAMSVSAGIYSFQIGTGVEISKMQRMREDYLDVQIRSENKNLGYWEAKSDSLSKIEEILNEPSDEGIAYVMNEFWKGWQELAKDPDSAAARAVVRQRGVAVTESFKSIMDSLDQMQTDLKHVINTKTEEVNSLATQIANLNDQIGRLVANNYDPNDLYDQRDLLVDLLSKVVDVKVTNSVHGKVDISVGGELLVEGNTAKELTFEYDSTSGLVDPNTISIGDKKITLVSGELLGRFEAYGLVNGGSESTVPYIKGKINDYAMTIVKAINDAHMEGENLDNINNGTTTKYTFFTGTSAQDLDVNQKILDSLDYIAAAQKDPLTGIASTGNGDNAKVIADLLLTKNLDFSGTTSTVNDFYRNVIGQLGIDSQEAARMRENSQGIVEQVENRRQSISGVSLDEEMTNMIKFQQAYNAAARMVSVMDECLDKVINGMGRVGL